MSFPSSPITSVVASTRQRPPQPAAPFNNNIRGAPTIRRAVPPPPVDAARRVLAPQREMRGPRGPQQPNNLGDVSRSSTRDTSWGGDTISGSSTPTHHDNNPPSPHEIFVTRHRALATLLDKMWDIYYSHGPPSFTSHSLYSSVREEITTNPSLVSPASITQLDYETLVLLCSVLGLAAIGNCSSILTKINIYRGHREVDDFMEAYGKELQQLFIRHYASATTTLSDSPYPTQEQQLPKDPASATTRVTKEEDKDDDVVELEEEDVDEVASPMEAVVVKWFDDTAAPMDALLDEFRTEAQFDLSEVENHNLLVAVEDYSDNFCDLGGSDNSGKDFLSDATFWQKVLLQLSISGVLSHSGGVFTPKHNCVDVLPFEETYLPPTAYWIGLGRPPPAPNWMNRKLGVFEMWWMLRIVFDRGKYIGVLFSGGLLWIFRLVWLVRTVFDRGKVVSGIIELSLLRGKDVLIDLRGIGTTTVNGRLPPLQSLMSNYFGFYFHWIIG